MTTQTRKAIKEIKKAAKQVNKSNEQFKRLTAPEKRIAIAKDVLAQLRSKKIVAKHLEYLNVAKNEQDKTCAAIREADPKAELRDIVKKFPTCQVCARGAIFVSALKLFNNFAVDNIEDREFRSEYPIDTEAMFKLGRRYFSDTQAALIELAFEGELGVLEYEEEQLLNKSMIEPAVAFHSRYKNAKDRLVAIMQNIIKNEGKFIP